MLLKMAWRNLWRSKRRTLITLGSVAFGVWLAVTFIGIGENSYSGMLETGARMGAGHVTIQPKGYQDAPGLDRSIPDGERIRAAIAAEPDVERAVARIAAQSMFATARRSVGGALFGVDPRYESGADNVFLDAIVEGTAFETPDAKQILIGRGMANKLGVGLKKRVVYTLVDEHGELVSDVARVVGIFDTGVIEVDSGVALLPIDTVRKLLGYGEGEATMVSVFLEDHREADAARAKLATSYEAGDREVLTWKSTQPELAGVIAMDRTMNYIFQILIGLLIAAGVFNTLLMSVLERRREFGVMMAIGTRPRELFELVVAESVLVGLGGLVAGGLLTIPWYWFMNTHGIDMSAIQGSQTSVNGVLVDPIMRLLLYPSSMVAILCGVLVLTVLAGLYPAWQAGRVPPVESLKA